MRSRWSSFILLSLGSQILFLRQTDEDIDRIKTEISSDGDDVADDDEEDPDALDFDVELHTRRYQHSRDSIEEIVVEREARKC